MSKLKEYQDLDFQIRHEDNYDREVGLNEKMEFVKQHYIHCTDGVDACMVCEMVQALMEEYTTVELMEVVDDE